MDDPGPPCPGSPEDGREPFCRPAIAYPDQLVAGATGIGQRAEKVEGGRHAELPAGRSDVAHRRVVARGKTKAHAGLPDAAGD